MELAIVTGKLRAERARFPSCLRHTCFPLQYLMLRGVLREFSRGSYTDDSTETNLRSTPSTPSTPSALSTLSTPSSGKTFLSVRDHHHHQASSLISHSLVFVSCDVLASLFLLPQSLGSADVAASSDEYFFFQSIVSSIAFLT